MSDKFQPWTEPRRYCASDGCGNRLPPDARERLYCQTCMTRRVVVMREVREFERLTRCWARATVRRERMAYLRRSLTRRRVLEVLHAVRA